MNSSATHVTESIFPLAMFRLVVLASTQVEMLIADFSLEPRLICDRGVKPSAIDTAIAGGLDFHLYPLRNWIEDKLNQECVAKLKVAGIPFTSRL